MREDVEEKLIEMITNRERFVKWRPNYEKWLMVRIHQEDYQKDRIKNISEVLGSLSQRIILELGCGMGGLAVALRREGCDVIPLDFNMDYCQITRLRGQRYGMNVNPINALGESLPFKRQIFDTICCFNVLEHVQSTEKVLRELYRVLKAGGSVIVTVINKHAFKDPHYHLLLVNWMPKRVAEWYINQRKRSKPIPLYKDKQKLSDMNYFGFDEFKGLARGIGFDVVDVAYLQINQPFLIRNKKLKKCAEILKSIKQNKLAYLGFRSLSRIYSSTFEFILYKTP